MAEDTDFCEKSFQIGIAIGLITEGRIELNTVDVSEEDADG